MCNASQGQSMTKSLGLKEVLLKKPVTKMQNRASRYTRMSDNSLNFLSKFT